MFASIKLQYVGYNEKFVLAKKAEIKKKNLQILKDMNIIRQPNNEINKTTHQWGKVHN
jgi:hypothetical protein